MIAQTVTLELPELLYAQLQARAARRQRTVADEVLDVLSGAIPATEVLPTELEQTLNQLVHLDDAALWRAGRSRVSGDVATRLNELNAKCQREGLSETEERESEKLVRQYERAMLLRAQAAALLQQRGYDIASLLATA